MKKIIDEIKVRLTSNNCWCAEAVKKALELCANEWYCGLCEFTEKECALIKKNALALITSQEQRIKELGAKVADLQDELKCEKETNAHLSSQYMSESHLRHQVEEMLANGMSVVKAEAVREMQERLKDCFDNEIEHKSIYTESQVLFVIDQIAKEMLEGE